MECLKNQQKLTAFLDDRLDDAQTEAFVTHTKQCDICMEELAIQYLIYEGMNRLEDGGAFDLNGELQEKLESRMHRVRRRKFFNRLMLSLEVASVCAMALLSFFVLY